MQNGIPYWYFHNHGGGRWRAASWPASTRGRSLAEKIPPSRCDRLRGLSASELVRAGVVRHIEGGALPARANSTAAPSARVTRYRRVLHRRGFKSPVLDNIRAEIWLKLWGNLTFNPISSLSHSTLADICQYPPRASWRPA
jgi:2-dehydropantoate 2-reductase